MNATILRLGAVALLAGACRASAPAPEPMPAPAPAPTPSPTPPATPAPTPAPAAPAAPNAADVRFMQRMIHHHAQALTMAGLALERSERDDLRLIAERIAVSQRDEIASMQRWLRSKGLAAPDPLAAGGGHAGHEGMDHGAMPGMASQMELEALATSSGRRFDRRFIDLMITHHEGALTMVSELLASRGAAQDTAAFTIANEVDADQRAEIARLRAIRAKLDQ